VFTSTVSSTDVKSQFENFHTADWTSLYLYMAAVQSFGYTVQYLQQPIRTYF
jgi:hypothetical protein